MEKNIDYYLSLPYTRELIREEDGIWFVRIKELPGCFSQGRTAEEALRMIDDAMIGWLEIELEDGEFIPEPRLDEDYSGKFNTRVPKSLHRKLVEAADTDNVSLNQWINVALAEAVGTKGFSSLLVKTEERSSDKNLAWQGFIDGVQRILSDVMIDRKSSVSDEENFSSYLLQSLQASTDDCEKHRYDQAFERTTSLCTYLSKYKSDSPLLACLFQLIVSQSKLLHRLCTVDEDDRQMELTVKALLDNKLRIKQRESRELKILEVDAERIEETNTEFEIGY